MPVYPCRWPTCTAYVRDRRGYCNDHQQHAPKENADRHAYYDQHQRDPDAKRFYDSAAWQRARAQALAAHPVCRRCNREFATTVHHRKPLRDCTPAEKTDQRNLMSLCQSCHSAIEAEARKAAA